eukprot:366331-Chlamydomonas_euryale.AAC.22
MTGEVVIPRLPTGPIMGPEAVSLLKTFTRLQNGSDVRGIAIDGEYVVGKRADLHGRPGFGSST